MEEQDLPGGSGPRRGSAPHPVPAMVQPFLMLQGPSSSTSGAVRNFPDQLLSTKANNTSLGDNVPAEDIHDADECPPSWFAGWPVQNHAASPFPRMSSPPIPLEIGSAPAQKQVEQEERHVFFLRCVGEICGRACTGEGLSAWDSQV